MAKRKLRGLCPVGPDFQKLVSNPNIGRIEAYRDWMENNGVVRSVDEVLEKLDKRYSTSTVREGVSELFESNPELAKIGTPEQYSQYLDTIFPDSKVKDIVYHGTRTKEEFEKFITEREYPIQLPQFKGKISKGAFFTKDKNIADVAGIRTITAILNMENPLYRNKGSEYLFKEDVEDIQKNNDSLIAPGNKEELIVFEPEQIHILGSKQDIEGFKNFVSASAEERVAFYSDKYNATVDDITNKTILTESTPMTFTESGDNNTKGIRLMTTLADSLSERMGVPYQVISAKEAIEMLANTERKWNGHPAFVFNGTVYFIEGMMKPEIVFHEFSHPFVKGVYNSNPDLFYKLYDGLKNTDEGKQVIRDVARRNQDLYEGTYPFMEEAIVRALELKATASKSGKGLSKKFTDYIKELLYQFKKFIKAFSKVVDPKSKIDVSKLDENTTLDQLAEMLMGTKAFAFKEVKAETDKTDLTKQVDFYSYIRDQSEEIASMTMVAPRDLTDMATQGIKAVSKNLRMIKNRRNKEEMFETLKDEMGLSNLEEIRSNLTPYTDYMEQRLGEIIDEIDYNQKHVEALVNTYFRLSKTMKKITKHLKEITKDVDNPENLARAHSYMSVINTWDNFIDYTLEVFNNNNIPTDNKMSTLVSGIKDEINRGKQEISKIKAQGVRDTFYDMLTDISASGQRRFEEMVAHYKKYNYKQYMTDRAYVEWYGMTEAEWKEFQKMEDTGAIQGRRYQELKEKSFKGAYITKEKIELTLSGQMNDVHWMNSYFEGYLYNDDPIVASLSLFVKKGLDDAMILSQAMYNDFDTELAPLIEKAGYGPNSMSEFGKRVGFIDSFGTNIDGEFTEFRVWTFLNKWKGDRIAVDRMKHEISEARLQWYKTNSDKDKEKLIELINKKEQHDIMYMHQQYVPEYYTIRSAFTSGGMNATAVKALVLRDDLLKKIRNLQEKIPTDQDMFQVPEQIKQAWDEYKQLHSLTDVNGKPKTDEELAIAKELLRFRDMSRKFYEYNIIPGAFENALFKYEQKLINQGYRDDDFAKARRRWIEENTRVSVLPEFWKTRRELVEELKQILTSKSIDPSVASEQARIAEEISQAYTRMFDATAGFRDEDGQPEALSMSNNKLQLVKEQQELIETLRDKVIGYSGLSKNDQSRLRELDMKERLTSKEEDELNDLYDKRDKTYTKQQRQRIRAIFRELSRMSSNEPTDYYQVAFNNLLRSIEGNPENSEIINRIRNYYGSTELSKSQLNNILDPDMETRIILTELMKIDEFSEWFNRNHTSKVEKDFDEPGNEMVVKYKRTYVWSVVRPTDSEFYNGFEIKDENGRVIEKIDRIPNIRFYKRDVKKEYWTGYNPLTGEVNLEVGVHVDNKMRFLPREDVVNSPYMNKEYYDLRDREPDLFKALEALTKWTLKIQDGMDNASRNYLDFPRFEQSRIEFARNNNVLKEKTSAFKATIKRLKNFFLGNKETAPEIKGQWSDEFRVAQLDIFDEDEEYHAPIHGLYNLPPEEVSTEITSSLLRYMVSANKNKALTEMYPTAKALKDVLDGNGFGKLKKLTKRHLTGDGETVSRNSDQNEIRRQVVSNFIDREFHGQTVAGPGNDNVALHALSQNMFQLASLGFFGFNVDSAVKNSIGQKIQGTLEAIAGRYYNMRDLALAEGWAFKTMGELSFQIYGTSPKSHNVQLWEIFDPTSDFKKKAAKEGMTRTFLKDLSEPSGIAMNFRKWTEIQSMMQIWGAMMYNTKVEQNGKMIDWIDAWETKDGKVRLKEGVDPEWGITYDAEGNQIIGSKFKTRRQQMQSVLIKLQGAYDDFNQPEAQRYLVMKFISFMRRYFVPMFIDRFGFKWKNGSAQARMQIGLNEYTEGYYVSLLRHLKDALFHGPKRLFLATPDERRAWLKTVGDFAILGTFILLESMLFGWRDDDDDRFEKLRQKSGPLPGPFVAEDEYKFNLSGFIHNKALNMMMQVRAEQQQFIPIPGLGLRNYNEMIDQLGTSAAFSPTIGTAFNLFQDVFNLMTGSEKAYYQREVGPYLWQQEGGSKFVAHLAKSIGLTGTFYQAELGIKKLEAVEQGFAGGK